ncbi:hypothetical protein PR048_020373 [Dryococelus australis]|uniref:Uncharacterized protein n=1 Tax=Dryococelus australis TaxID=614101 RepID=A0ABQ9H641_9NEOP|nr:hypothetical protein PR048_020373 [Dryococelus australis]
MEEWWDARAGETGVAREHPLANGNVYHISHMRKHHPDFGFTLYPEIAPGQYWYGSSLRIMDDSFLVRASMSNWILLEDISPEFLQYVPSAVGQSLSQLDGATAHLLMLHVSTCVRCLGTGESAEMGSLHGMPDLPILILRTFTVDNPVASFTLVSCTKHNSTIFFPIINCLEEQHSIDPEQELFIFHLQHPPSNTSPFQGEYANEPSITKVKLALTDPDNAPASKNHLAQPNLTVCNFQCQNDTHVKSVEILPQKCLVPNIPSPTYTDRKKGSIPKIRHEPIGTIELNLPCHCEFRTQNMILIQSRIFCDGRTPNTTHVNIGIPDQWLRNMNFQWEQLQISTSVHDERHLQAYRRASNQVVTIAARRATRRTKEHTRKRPHARPGQDHGVSSSNQEPKARPRTCKTTPEDSHSALAKTHKEYFGPAKSVVSRKHNIPSTRLHPQSTVATNQNPLRQQTRGGVSSVDRAARAGEDTVGDSKTDGVAEAYLECSTNCSWSVELGGLRDIFEHLRQFLLRRLRLCCEVERSHIQHCFDVEQMLEMNEVIRDGASCSQNGRRICHGLLQGIVPEFSPGVIAANRYQVGRTEIRTSVIVEYYPQTSVYNTSIYMYMVQSVYNTSIYMYRVQSVYNTSIYMYMVQSVYNTSIYMCMVQSVYNTSIYMYMVQSVYNTSIYMYMVQSVYNTSIYKNTRANIRLKRGENGSVAGMTKPEGRGVEGDLRENPPTRAASSTISTRENPGASILEIEPGSPGWESLCHYIFPKVSFDWFLYGGIQDVECGLSRTCGVPGATRECRTFPKVAGYDLQTCKSYSVSQMLGRNPIPGHVKDLPDRLAFASEYHNAQSTIERYACTVSRALTYREDVTQGCCASGEMPR